MCVRTCQRLGCAAHPGHHCSWCALLFFFFKKSEAFSLCGFATPFFFSPNSRSPITRSNLEFIASNNCLMDPHVYTAWHWHPDSVMKVITSATVSCFLPASKNQTETKREKKEELKREKLRALFSWYSGVQWMVPLLQPPVLSQNFWKTLFLSALTENANSQVFYQYLLYQ